MYTATLHWVIGDFADKKEIEAETLEELQKLALAEVTKCRAQQYWSSDVRRNGEPV